jgi:MFS family permease
MGDLDDKGGRGKWMALTAALLGWMFDGLEMGLFPLVARPALRDLLGSGAVEADIGKWFAGATAAFLVGAATGGVLFGWLGDRMGRVRAMTLSVLTYAVFSGLCGFATAPWQIVVLRFASSLGMGGEWSLGVALVMEVWPGKSRAFLAGLIGAAANFGYMFIALLGLALSQKALDQLGSGLQGLGLPENWVAPLVAHSGWRLLMLLGAAPAILTFFIRLFVPESERWLHERQRGATSSWAARDLLGVLIGAAGAGLIIYLWAIEVPWPVFVAGALVGVTVTTAGYLYPVIRYLQRMGDTAAARSTTVRRMLLGACLSGVALLATWAAVQWAPTWADQLTGGKVPEAKAYTQFWGALGAVFGTIAAALLADAVGRRLAYTLMCLASMGSVLMFYLGNTAFDARFLASMFVVGFMTASFYGWLPLYLPELFPTRVRATGQGFGFNFGRILAAIGVLQTSSLMKVFEQSGYPKACSAMSLIYLVGVVIIWFAPETRGKPLPE